MGTIRQDLLELLKEETLDAKDISQLLSIREKEVYGHLDHIARSIAAEGGRLKINPCKCLACGYLFKERKRFSRPGKCPKCRETRIRPATYHIEAKS
ncbi:MAG: transcriptional regulator [Desulfobulbaceae bacterium]|nr:transcriptional regulator [Desulfobulbaceae bacterium]